MEFIIFALGLALGAAGMRFFGARANAAYQAELAAAKAQLATLQAKVKV